MAEGGHDEADIMKEGLREVMMKHKTLRTGQFQYEEMAQGCHDEADMREERAEGGHDEAQDPQNWTISIRGED